MHDPVGARAMGCAASVVNEGLLHAHRAFLGVHLPVLPGGLPISGPRRAVRPRAVRILAVPRAEEVPLQVLAW